VYYPPAQFDRSAGSPPLVSVRFILRREEETVLDETNRYRPRTASQGSVEVLKVISGPVLAPGAYSLEAHLSEPTTPFNDLARLDFTVDGPQEMGRLSTVGLDETRPAVKFLLRAHQYVLAGDYQNAITRFQAALDYEPTLQAARLGKARAQIFAGDPVSGEQTARQALERDPEDFDAVTMVGLALFRQGRYDEAVASYRRAMILGGESVAILNALGEAEFHAGNVEAAQKALLRSLELDPDQEEVRGFLDQISKTSGQRNPPI
jgi:cytochrome c-type biogenesis protein CcmH/NrfG